MFWRRIEKEKATPGKASKYSDWKPELAKEASHRCVYCSIFEGHFGGQRNFHVEHFRPKSLREDLTMVYANLFYACGICNIFKSDDWPSEPKAGDYSFIHYPDPSQTDYSDFLAIDASGLVASQSVTGRYIIEQLHLNRPQMVINRRLIALVNELTALSGELEQYVQADNQPDDMKELVSVFASIITLLKELWFAVPYEAKQTR